MVKNYSINSRSGVTYVNKLTFILFLKSLDYKHLPPLSESTTTFCRFYDICFLCVLADRATLFPGKRRKKSRKKKKSKKKFSGLAGSLSLFSTGSLKIILHFQLFFPFFFFRFVCVRVLGARHRGRAMRRRGCQRMLAGKGGFARSAVVVFVAWRRVCLETRRKHEWAPSGLHLKNRLNMYELIRVLRDCKIRFKRSLFLRTTLKFAERRTQSEHQNCRAGQRGSR